MFGKFNIFGGNKSEGAPANEENKPLVDTDYTKGPQSNEKSYGDYADNIETDEMGVARPHDVHMAKNKAVLEQDNAKEEDMDMAA